MWTSPKNNTKAAHHRLSFFRLPYLTIIGKNPEKTAILFNNNLPKQVQNFRLNTKILLLSCKRETYATHRFTRVWNNKSINF